MEINGDQPPLIWPQFESTTYTRRRSPIPTMLVPAMIGVLSAAVFLLFTTFVVPPFLSVTSQILQPASVKRGWDSINVVLVLFAIICGVLARRNDDGSLIGEEQGQGAMIGETVGDDVYDADRLKIYESLSRLPVTGGLPLRRSSSSYPDLRNGVFRETVDRRFRFYDDFEIDKYRSEESTVVIEEQFRSLSKTEIEESEAKEITVDKVVVTPSQQPPAPPPPNPPPLRRTHRSI
ncbi:hydroxyproline-rich glycoprotein family protein [Raphanus sativus]|nr:hydroxyproline-rich glycoprotein family protein [Raphanus sativus]